MLRKNRKNNSFISVRVLLVKNLLDRVATGLVKAIGLPADYNKNKLANSFPSSYDLNIPGTNDDQIDNRDLEDQLDNFNFDDEPKKC